MFHVARLFYIILNCNTNKYAFVAEPTNADFVAYKYNMYISMLCKHDMAVATVNTYERTQRD